MKNILIISSSKVSFMVLYFLKYRIDRGYSDVTYNTYKAFKNKKDNKGHRDINELFFKFNYKDYNIDFKIYKNFNSEIFEEILKTNENQYDKIIL